MNQRGKESDTKLRNETSMVSLESATYIRDNMALSKRVCLIHYPRGVPLLRPNSTSRRRAHMFLQVGILIYIFGS